jgi:predicted transcriptional regulator
MKNSDAGARIVDKRKHWEARVEMAIFKLPKSELSTYDKLVYAILCGHANRDGNAMLYVRTIAEEASCSERQVRRALSNLEDHHLLLRHSQKIHGQGQICNIYEIYDFEEYISSDTQKCFDEDVQEDDSQANVEQESGFQSDEEQPKTSLPANHVSLNSQTSLPVSQVSPDLQTGLPISHTSPDWSDSQAGLPISHDWPACQAGFNNVFKQPLKNIKENTPPSPPRGQNWGEGEGKKPPEEQKQNGTEEKAKGTQASGTEFFELVLNAYNIALPELPKAEKVTTSRAETIRQRIRGDPARIKLSWWKQFFARVRGFPWPMGDNPSNWRADFDWLLSEKGMQKILEGGFARTVAPKFGEGTKSGWELQKKYTDERGRIDGRAILREIQASQARG